MKTFNEFEAARTHLLSSYDRLLSSGILPVEQTQVAQVEERRKDLLSGRFILAVCGRINSGKSTLVNSLLFQELVLPSDHTPHTAKNTLIKYGETPSFRVTFYNTEEWSHLTAEMAQSTSDVAQKYQDDLEVVANKGVYKDEYIRPAALTKTVEGLNSLHEYVTPATKDGRYTPFVKEVIVYYPHQWLRSVTVADTPGVDDPYKFREDQTKRFVTQAGSILFVTSAGYAMAKPDFDFLNEYLLHVPKQKRVIAVNKIDVLNGGRDELELYMETLYTHSEPSIRDVFGTKGSIAYVSSLGSLISQMETSGIELSDELRWYKERLASKGFLHSQENGMDALRLLVEERLVTLKGTDIIDGHFAFIVAIFERKRRILNNLIASNNARLGDLEKTNDELKAQIAEIESDLQSLKRDFRNQKVTINRVVEQSFAKFQQELQRLGSIILEKTRADLDRVDNIKALPSQAAWFFTHYFDEKTLELNQVFNKCLTDVELCINDFSVKMKGKWMKWEAGHVLDCMLDYSTFSAIKELQEKTREIAETQNLEKIRENNTNFLECFFNDKNARELTKAKILDQMKSSFNRCLKEKAEHVTQMITDELRSHMEKMEDGLQEVLRSRLDQKAKLVSGQTNREREKEQIEAENEKYKEGLTELETLEKYAIAKHRSPVICP